MSSIKCPNCGLMNFFGTGECRRCNQPLVGVPALATASQTITTNVATLSEPDSLSEPDGLRIPVLLPALLILGVMFIVKGSILPGGPQNFRRYMTIAEISTLVLIAIGFAGVMFARKPTPVIDGEEPLIDGFLIIPVTALIIDFTIRVVTVIEGVQILHHIKPIIAYRGIMPEEINLLPLATAEVFANAVLALFAIFLLVRFFIKHKSVPACMIAIIVIEMAWLFLDYVIGNNLIGDVKIMTPSGPKSFGELAETSAFDLLYLPVLLLNRLVAIPYFILSKRVKATFSREQYEEY